MSEDAGTKIQAYQEGTQAILRNCWVEGSGYLMKRRYVEEIGTLGPAQSFTDYCIKLALRGRINGWYYPFIRQEHMDDPRAAHTMLKCDADLERYMPLSAATFGIHSLAEWKQALRNDARIVQAASLDPRTHLGWRRRIKRVIRKVIRR